MSLHDDLRDQAQQLARAERYRPKQSSLRRAVSTAYYSLFHLLIDEAARLMLGGSRHQRSHRDAIARGFSHSSMVGACKSFAAASLPRALTEMLPRFSVSAELRVVADTFGELQYQRHQADYNRAAAFTRSEVVELLSSLDSAMEAWKRVRKDETARFFLVCLAMWEQLRRV
jgi:uncharacterized protein (UPF0332 family)